MLARSGPLPARGAWAYEVKWDGFRAIVSTEGPLRVRSRRGWNMAPHLEVLAELPVRGVFDGELVAFGADGKPDFVKVCERLLHGREEIPLTFVIFDLLRIERHDVRRKRYRERRRLRRARPHWTDVVRRRGIRGWQSAVERRLRTRTRGGCREAAGRALYTTEARLGEGQEPFVVALRA